MIPLTPNNEKKTQVFFQNLNGVRAIAAMMVVVAHIELHKADFSIARFGGLQFHNLGKVGVTVFFSLSGFLITYLLLEEKRNYVKVNFKDFYVRRILRIWPLYFLVIVFGFFIYPKSGSSEALWLSVFFLPNLAFILNILPGIFDTIWSIGTEEQFYIFHPHFFRIKKNQHILYALVLFIIGFFVVNEFIKHFFHNSTGQILSQLFYYARYDDMIIGAIVAVLYFNTKHKTFDFKLQKLFDFMFNKYIQAVLLIAFFGFVWVYITYETPQGDVALSILSALLIVNLCETGTSIYSLNNKAFQFTGKISYGIYMLHKFPLFLVLYLVKNYLSGTPAIIQNVAIYAGTFVAAISIAALSYYGYERYFLKLKTRFQRVTSRF